MLCGRGAVGSVSIDWREAALGIGKYRRKTVGFGRYDKKEREFEFEVYIRELTIIDGGIGCAIWDAAIILSRFLFKNKRITKNKRVLELGAGVGLPGIVTATNAAFVQLTDFIDPLIENLQYNININAKIIDEEENEENEENESNNNDNVNKNDENNNNDDDEMSRVNTVKWKRNIGKCCNCKFLDWEEIGSLKDVEFGSFDVVIGSELTYTGEIERIKNLVRVIDSYLAKDGIFIEILSTDRDGVDAFVEIITSPPYNYNIQIDEIDEEFISNAQNKKITKQKTETYKLYTCKRQTPLCCT